MVFQSFVFLTEIRISPTKPHGKGSKRKQDELDEDEDDYDDDEEEEEGRPTWVEVLTQEISDDEAPEEDPDYEVGDQTRWLLQPSPSTTHTHTRVCVFSPAPWRRRVRSTARTTARKVTLTLRRKAWW